MDALNQEQGLFKQFFGNTVIKFFLSSGTATLADVIVYFITINYVLNYGRVQLGNTTASAHNLALCISYSWGIIINFLLAKYAVFSESTVRGRKQFFRFSLIAILGFFANYALLRLFVEVLGFYPTISRIVSALSLGFAAYYVHKVFTFKISN